MEEKKTGNRMGKGGGGGRGVGERWCLEGEVEKNRNYLSQRGKKRWGERVTKNPQIGRRHRNRGNDSYRGKAICRNNRRGKVRKGGIRPGTSEGKKKIGLKKRSGKNWKKVGMQPAWQDINNIRGKRGRRNF